MWSDAGLGGRLLPVSGGPQPGTCRAARAGREAASTGAGQVTHPWGLPSSACSQDTPSSTGTSALHAQM